jgi:aspartyl-tRNA(Asn)/glutamyl-tRNA(Gln) amidotransferase subunit B
MRLKETADDYRYFPEPDMVPFHLSDEFVQGVSERLPELPDAKKQRYVELYALPVADALNIAGDPELAAFFDTAMVSAGQGVASTPQSLAKPVANLLLNDVSAWLNQSATTLSEAAFSAADLSELASFAATGSISSKQVKQVFTLMTESGRPPAQIIDEQGLRQVSDSGAIEAVIDEILTAYPDKVAEYQSGKTGLLGFFVGQAMKQMKGQGNPRLISDLLTERLK